jgi:hypothetical protein
LIHGLQALLNRKVLNMDTMDKPEKKPYTPPELIEYGDLAEITGSGMVGNVDAISIGSIVV